MNTALNSSAESVQKRSNSVTLPTSVVRCLTLCGSAFTAITIWCDTRNVHHQADGLNSRLYVPHQRIRKARRRATKRYAPTRRQGILIVQPPGECYWSGAWLGFRLVFHSNRSAKMHRCWARDLGETDWQTDGSLHCLMSLWQDGAQ